MLTRVFGASSVFQKVVSFYALTWVGVYCAFFFIIYPISVFKKKKIFYQTSLLIHPVFEVCTVGVCK